MTIRPTPPAALLMAAALLASALACGPAPTAVPTPAPASPAGPTPVGGRVTDLALATVQVLALDASGGRLQPVWSGSGSVIGPDGLILTNAHVVDNRYGEYTDLGIALLRRSDQPPDLAYLAEIVAVDYALDLAVVRIVSDLTGNPVQLELPYVALGDSDLVEIGDRLQILGYPGIGGDTITFTEGVVSGFTSERSVAGRAWIKTDATIAGGNSGGLAANAAGELIGIPTRASSGAEQADIVDCRPVADTNRDGVVDERDTCVPIGGFINGLRPINLARPLIEAALGGAAYQTAIESEVRPPGGFDLNRVRFAGLVFSDGVTADDRPARRLPALPPAPADVCAFWDYEGMLDGMTWSAYWLLDGALDEGGSVLNASWAGGARGNWWVCMHSERGLPDGVYEVVLEVEGEVLLADAVFVGGQRPEITFTLVNPTGADLIGVQLSPSLATHWGPNDLAAGEVLAPGARRAFQIPAGTYDLRLIDRAGETQAEEYGLDLFQDTGYPLAGGASASAVVELINRSAVTLCDVYISPVTDTTWGLDWLAPSESVAPGGTRLFNVPSRRYDLRADDCSGNPAFEQYGFSIGAGGFTWSVGSTEGGTSGTGGGGSLRLVNNSGTTVCYVYISPVTDTTWGSDWLGSSETVASGGSRTFSVTQGLYDLRADDCSHNILNDTRGAQIGPDTTWTIGPP